MQCSMKISSGLLIKQSNVQNAKVMLQMNFGINLRLPTKRIKTISISRAGRLHRWASCRWGIKRISYCNKHERIRLKSVTSCHELDDCFCWHASSPWQVSASLHFCFKLAAFQEHNDC